MALFATVLPWTCLLALNAVPPTAASAEDAPVEVTTATTEAPSAPTADALAPAPGAAPAATPGAAEPEAKPPRYGGKKPNTIYLEGGGPAMLYSLNYDRMVHEYFSLRAGISYWGLRGTLSSGDNQADVRAHFVSVPLMANFLLGRKGHHLEAGAGANLLFASGSVAAQSGGLFSDARGSAFEPLGTASVGYRYAPFKTGVSFRAGFSPLFSRDFFQPWGYISLGVAF